METKINPRPPEEVDMETKINPRPPEEVDMETKINPRPPEEVKEVTDRRQQYHYNFFNTYLLIYHSKINE